MHVFRGQVSRPEDARPRALIQIDGDGKLRLAQIGVRRDKAPVTVFLISGVKLIGKIKGFDKYSVILEANNQEQLIFKHAISTVVMSRAVHAERHLEPRTTAEVATPATASTTAEG